jgi:superoxide dismutase, Cu-Zn family
MRITRLSLVAVLLAAAACHRGTRSAPPAAPSRAHAELRDLAGTPIGVATIEQTNRGVLLTLTLTGAPEGIHAVHFHSVGQCQPPFESAGPHFNPTGHHHGYYSADGGHAGDLPNISIPGNGNLRVELLAATASVGGRSGLLDADGAALVLHAAADDYRTDPSGSSGARVACGVVTP